MSTFKLMWRRTAKERASSLNSSTTNHINSIKTSIEAQMVLGKKSYCCSVGKKLPMGLIENLEDHFIKEGLQVDVDNVNNLLTLSWSKLV